MKKYRFVRAYSTVLINYKYIINIKYLYINPVI